MKILCLDQFGELGGAQRCLLDLLPAMAERGWSVHVAAPTGPLAERVTAMHATFDPIVCGPYSSGHKTVADMARFVAEAPRLACQIRKLTQRYQVDLIYVNGPRLLPAAALAGRNGPRILFHSHSLLAGMALRVAGTSLRMARAAMVASCRFVAAPLLPYSGGRGVAVVYNGVRRIRETNREGAEDLRIGVIGRISPEKGQADFLRAARIMHETEPRFRFVICGAPLFSDPAAMRYAAALQALADGLPIEFRGWTEDVESVLDTLDLLVVPSTAVDATPRVILEAFAAGVPVAAFASGGIPEIVEHGTTGFLVEQRSPKALAAAMLSAMEQPHRRHEVAHRALVKARTELSLERYRAEMLAVMEAAVVDAPAPYNSG